MEPTEITTVWQMCDECGHRQKKERYVAGIKTVCYYNLIPQVVGGNKVVCSMFSKSNFKLVKKKMIVEGGGE